MNKLIFTVKSKSDLEKCYPLIKELRPHLSYQDFLSIYEESHHSNGYEIVGIEEDGQILALMGYRNLTDFVRGKHVYIDDLVTNTNVRSKGLGSELLAYAENIAKNSGCKTLRLCTGIENELGMKFYERNGWIKRAFTYTKKLDSN